MSPQSWRAGAFGMGAALVSSFGQTYFIGLFGLHLREAHALTTGTLGALYGAATLASGALMFWLGALADRAPLRRTVVLAGAILAGGCLLMATAQGAVALAVAFLLLRFGGQGMLSHLAIVSAARATATRRGRSVAIAIAGFIIGEALWPATVAAALLYADWRVVWVAAAVLVALVAVPTLRSLATVFGSEHAQPLPPSASGGVAISRLQLLAQPRFVAALGVTLVPAFVVTAIFFHLTAIAALRGWTAGSLAFGFVVFALSQFAAITAMGRIVDSVGSARPMRLHLLPMALAILALGLPDFGAPVWVTFAGLGLTSGANAVIGGALWAEIFGTRQVGMVRGVYAAYAVAASAISPFLLGTALEHAVPLAWVAAVGALYCIVAPPLLVERVRR